MLNRIISSKIGADDGFVGEPWRRSQHAFQQFRIRLAQIDQQETVHHVGKCCVDAEAEERAVQFEIILLQNRYTLAVFFSNARLFLLR